MTHSPHHRTLTRLCAICEQRRTWKGGRRFRTDMAREKFVCGGCLAKHLAATLGDLKRRQAKELGELRAKHRAELERAAWGALFPLFAQN